MFVGGAAQFVFNFNLEGTNKSHDAKDVGMLAEMVWKQKPNCHVANFVTFLSQEGRPKVVLDDWMNFLEFSNINKKKDLSGYEDMDENLSMPVIIDEFVDFCLANPLT